MNLHPEDMLRVIKSETFDYVARVAKSLPFDGRKRATSQIVPDKPQNISEIIGGKRTDYARSRRRYGK